MQGYIFGAPGLPQTPQELAERRKMLRSIIARNNARPPQDLWEGLTSFADGIGTRIGNQRLDRIEAENQAKASGDFNTLVGAMTKTGAPISASNPESLKAGASSDQPRMSTAVQPAVDPGSPNIGFSDKVQSTAQKPMTPDNPYGLDTQLLQVAANPWNTDGQNLIVQTLLRKEIEKADPMYGLNKKKAELEIDQIEHPRMTPYQQAQIDLENAKSNSPDYGFVELPDGSVVRTDKHRGTVEPVYGATKQKPRPATAEEKSAFGVGPEVPLIIGEDGKPSILSPGGVNIDLGDSSFDKELGKGLAGIYVNQIEQGNNAIATKAGMQQIRQLMKGRGGALDGFASVVAPYLPEGLLPEGANDVTAAQAIISGLTPKQRVAGSGSTSDFDAKMFSKGLPSVWNRPGANELIADTIEAYSDYQVAVSDIIQNVASDSSIKNKPAAIREAVKQMADPFARWKDYIKNNPVQPGKSDSQAKPPAQPFSAPDADGWVTAPDGTQIKRVK